MVFFLPWNTNRDNLKWMGTPLLMYILSVLILKTFVWETDRNLHHSSLTNFTTALESHSCSYWNMVHQKVSDLWFWFDVNNLNIVGSHVSPDQLRHYIFTNENWEAQLRGVEIYVDFCVEFWSVRHTNLQYVILIILCVILSYLQLDSPWSF